MQVFKHQLNLPCKLGKGLGIEQFNFYNFSFSNGFKDKRNVIETVLTYFFSKKKKKIKKIAQRLDDLPHSPIFYGSWGLCPQTPGCSPRSCTGWLTTPTKRGQSIKPIIQYNFGMFCSYFVAPIAKIFNKYKQISPVKGFKKSSM